ncbi:MAG: leucyl aminopeptidase, partial [Nitrospirae bacterium]|nr:leucyl aminopeptidase [Candidatus Manganitrophaceae bacterium]
ISLKPGANMEQMKYDMAGGATVLGVMKAVAALKLPLDIVAILPATDNMPSGKAIHPGDVVTSLSGKTIEIINTDAEGRLCLADALTYGTRFKPAAMINLATLTGACVVALGQHAMGMMGNNPALLKKVQAAGEAVSERTWELPLWDTYQNQIESPVADLQNVGGRGAGTITAGLFLKAFVGDVPWVHLDIAGTSWYNDGRHPYVPKGASGVGVRLLVYYLTTLTDRKSR